MEERPKPYPSRTPEPGSGRELPRGPVTRRGFLSVGTSVVVVATLEACISEGLRSQKGVITLAVLGDTQAMPNGGTATISRPSGNQMEVAVPTSGEARVVIDIGQYTVQYTPPTGFQLVSGNVTELRTVSVELDRTTTFSFQVVEQALVGTLEITVTGAAIGSATVESIAGTVSARVVAITGGFGRSSSLPAGDYRVTYVPPTGFIDTSATNPIDVNVVAGATSQAAFTAAVAPGALHVVVSGLAGAPSTGQISVTGPQGVQPLPLSLITGGQATGDLSGLTAGAYTVTLSPPTGFEVTGSSATSAVSIAPGGTANVSFAVQVTPGSVDVAVSGLSGAASGGSVSVVRQDAPGTAVTQNLSVPINGVSASSVPGLSPGSYQITYTPPAGFSVTSAVTSTVSVATGQAAATAFTVAANPGTLRLVVSGVDPAAPGAGTATIQRTDIPGQAPTPVSVPPSGALDTPLAPGTYLAAFAAPAGYELTPGQNNPRSTLVIGDQTSIVAFQVGTIAADGSLHVVVDGLDAAAADGGNLEVLRTDISGQTPVVYGILASGILDVTLAPGAYRLTYAAPTNHQLSPGQQNPRTMAIQSSQTAPTTFQVMVIPPPVGILFSSDWRTGTGQTTAAIRDTSQAASWDTHQGSGFASSGIETAAALGLTNWPTANAFIVRAFDDSPDRLASAQIHRNLGTPTNGSHRYFRLYAAMLWGDSHGDGTTGHGEHGIESAAVGSGGGTGWNLYQIPNSDGTWFPGFREISTGVRYVADGLTLAKNATYRLEWHLAYGAGSYQVQVRIYNAAGTLVGDEDDFYLRSPLIDQTQRLGAGMFTLADATNHGWFRVGCNGPGSNFPLSNIVANEPFRAHGAVAVSDSNWIGPYSNGI
jgi:hypothetical protein